MFSELYTLKFREKFAEYDCVIRFMINQEIEQPSKNVIFKYCLFYLWGQV